MYYFAFVLLALSMLCALAGAAWAVKSLWPRTAPAAGKASRRTSVPGLGFVEKANLCLTGCYIIASAILIYALASYDFSLVYVASYTDRLLPLFYRITAFWAGQAGSMLFWAFSVAICGGLFQLTRSYKSLTPDTRLWYWVFYLGIMSFFGLILVTWNNPFLMNHAVPQDGNGLNPLLQNPGMIFHPPLLFLGYGGFVIPSCLALAQALSRRQADEAAWTDVARPFTLAAWAMLTAGIVLGGWWAYMELGYGGFVIPSCLALAQALSRRQADEAAWTDVARPFTLAAWAMLTAGIVLGGWWAYMELGWGGYWAWDPVENASLIPWLIATAALHTMLIQTRRNKLHGVNVFLMALTTISAFFATYLVRSGVVQSVHAFGSGGVGVPLLLFILISVALSFWIALLARRSDTGELAGIESREGFLILTSWLLLALSLIILIATMWPVFSAFWKETVMGLARDVVLDEAGHDHGGAVGLTADFYNRVCMPLFAAMVAILSICPWLGWNGGVRNMRKLLLVVCSFIGAAAAMYSLGYTLPVAVLGASASVAALVSMSLKLFERPVYSHAPSFAAYGIHIGVALIALGIAFSGPYKIESEPTMAMGETVKVGQFEVTFKNLYEGEGAGYIFLEGELEIRKDGKLIGIAAPQRRVYAKWGQMQFAEAAVIPSLGNEFYATLMAVDQQNRAVFRLSSNPLVNWLWIGGILMCLLPFVSFRRRNGREN